MMDWLLLPLSLLSGGPIEGALADLLARAFEQSPGSPGTVPVSAPDTGFNLPGVAAVASLALTSLISAGTRHVTRENVLEHDTRRKMHEYIWETGAAHLRRIADALDLSTTNATWHLDKLVDAGLVGEVKVNGYRMYYPKGGGRLLREQCILAGQIQSENARDIVDYLKENPGSHQREIARALDVNHGTARWHLSRLSEAGILTAQPDGRVTRYELTDHTERVIDQMPPLFYQQDEGAQVA